MVPLQNEIASAVVAAAGEQRKSSRDTPRRWVRKQLTLEFLKWIFFWFGVIGLLGVWVAYDRFLGWIELLNPLWLRNLLRVFSYEIVRNLPVATVTFTGFLIAGCILATLQKHTEVVSRLRADEAATLLSDLTVNFGEAREVLNDLSDVKTNLSTLSLDLSAAKEELLNETAKNTQISESLKEAKETITGLRRNVRELTKEKEMLKVGLKKHQREFNLLEINGIGMITLEKLRNVGIFKKSDLLKVAPDDLAHKTGISSKIIARWLEDAVTLSGNPSK